MEIAVPLIGIASGAASVWAMFKTVVTAGAAGTMMDLIPPSKRITVVDRLWLGAVFYGLVTLVLASFAGAALAAPLIEACR